jgi:Protein of unknown function (DUF3037)
MTFSSYTYTVLQYRHDVWSGEALNLGVLFYCPKSRYLSLKCRTGKGRIAKAFPTLDHTALRLVVKGLEQRFEHLLGMPGLFPPRFETALDWATSVLVADDSSLVWRGNGSGISACPEKEHEELFSRLVSQYDLEEGRDAISDEMVYERIRARLQVAELLDRVSPHIVQSEFATITFDCALKNGVWHCVQPISLDSADADRMQAKAFKWAGQMQGIQNEVGIKPYFITGKPRDLSLMPKYDQMKKLLAASPLSPVVIDIDHADLLVDKLRATLS